VFNPMSPSEVSLAIGEAARDAAAGSGSTSDFSRGQLMSAFSATRHLAVEIDAYADVAADTAREVGRQLSDLAPRMTREDVFRRCAAELASARDPRQVGRMLSEARDLLRSEPVDDLALADLHAALRRLVDEEVDLLAASIEPQRQS
jgi:hypothetical protein